MTIAASIIVMNTLALTPSTIAAAMEGPREPRPSAAQQAAIDAERHRWRRTDKRLTIGVALSAASTGIGAALLATGLGVAFSPCTTPSVELCDRGGSPRALTVVVPLGSVLLLYGVVATPIFGVKLGRHRRARAQLSARLQLAPGGVTLRY